MQIHIHPVLGEKFTEEVTFYFNNKPLKAKKGQTVAAALMANGIHNLGTSRKFLQPRGLYCATGRCMSCFVTINGVEHVLSCMTLVDEGMKVFPSNEDPDPGSEINGS